MRHDNKACNYEFTEQKGAILILHFLLGTKMRHNYASQILITLIWEWCNYSAQREERLDEIKPFDWITSFAFSTPEKGLIRKQAIEKQKKKIKNHIGSC